MKKNKGFTLIELLAVIVVLAIIALIATPIVMNTIKNSKKGAAERSGESYTKQVETAIMEYRMESGNTLPDGEYTIDSNGNLTGNGLTTPLTIEMSGTKPSGGKVKINNGQIEKESSFMTTKEYTVSYNTEKNTFVAKPLEVLCTAVTELSTQLLLDIDSKDYVQKQTGVLASDGNPYAYGVEYSCDVGDGESKTFYVLETQGNIVSLIMNENIGYTVRWLQYEEETNYKPAKEYLKEQTSGWTKLNSSQISMPTYSQIYTAAGNKESNLPTWLIANLNSSIYLHPAPYGYWTSTIYSVTDYYEVWGVSLMTSGGIYNIEAHYYNLGIRPVITISKTQLK